MTVSVGSAAAPTQQLMYGLFKPECYQKVRYIDSHVAALLRSTLLACSKCIPLKHAVAK
jgi:hypothetical protein